MKKALFLDRDGIINEVVLRDGIVSSPRHLDELKIIPEAIALAEAAKQLGYFVVLITNQPDVSRGKMTRYQLQKIHRKIGELIPLDHIEVCMSSDPACFRRKPNPGMLLQSGKKFSIDLSLSFFVGDSQRDVDAGNRAGVKTILYQTDYNKNSHGRAHFNCNSIKEIINFITQKE
jgi:D-glycero-D-manno-heptose 1,7-bisphosphate phosphatase